MMIERHNIFLLCTGPVLILGEIFICEVSLKSSNFIDKLIILLLKHLVLRVVFVDDNNLIFELLNLLSDFNVFLL